MRQSDGDRPSYTSEEAAARIEGLRRVFAQGFFTKDEFEAMKRHVLGRVRDRSQPAAAEQPA
jgi:hypothetical protein